MKQTTADKIFGQTVSVIVFLAVFYILKAEGYNTKKSFIVSAVLLLVLSWLNHLVLNKEKENKEDNSSS
jgi:formate/nitrite transporter FocA (FNT family)